MTHSQTEFSCRPILGGYEEGVSRFAPSPVLRAAGEYYVWYTRTTLSSASPRASVYYATSSDGETWTEQGKALKPSANPKDWDSGEVFNPTVMIANHFYWLFYVARRSGPLDRTEAPTGLGLAFSESPRGPWEKLILNPVLHPSHSKEPQYYRIDSACLLNRMGDYWLYYICRDYGEGDGQLRLAIAKSPDGPYVPQPDKLEIERSTFAVLWPQADGVAALTRSNLAQGLLHYSEDGIHFARRNEVTVPTAIGPFRQDAFAFTPVGPGICWGICEANDAPLPYLQRFDCDLDT